MRYHLKDGEWMAKPVVEKGRESQLRASETEKITINLGYVDLGQIDLLVRDGFYSNRTDLIRTAIRNHLERHAEVLERSTKRKKLDLGLQHYAARNSKRSAQRENASIFG